MSRTIIMDDSIYCSSKFIEMPDTYPYDVVRVVVQKNDRAVFDGIKVDKGAPIAEIVEFYRTKFMRKINSND